MSHLALRTALGLNCLISFATVAVGSPLAITVGSESSSPRDPFHLRAFKNPQGSAIGIDRDSLTLDGKPWTPVMGEFHYTRYPSDEWRGELLKMKAGGIDVVSTYVFWIHHEEIEGEWDWSDNHSLREFVELAGGVGLKVVVRCGPWCHGEVRNGGFPDWLVKSGWKLRSVDERFLGKVRGLYGEISKQLRGQLWKDGGPVIGIQLDNEFEGPSEYLLALKGIALDVGLDVPIYTRTGWTRLTTPMPFGEIVPLYGAYAEGFWSRELRPMPGNFWAAFRFSALRFDDNIASEQKGDRRVHDDPDASSYPYLTCEIGGGMMNSYHRRILINPEDVLSTTLIKLGSGSTLPGYYMYHGGTNPTGRLATLMEAQDTLLTNYNDLPVKNYDFQAPIGEFGQIRPQYHLLRRLHLFLSDFGAGLARMPAAMPDVRPGGQGDTETLRWAVRSDGTGGYVFVNNYERSQPMPAKRGVQFRVNRPTGQLTFPGHPIDVPADSMFFWPFELDLGFGIRLAYATAEPECEVEEPGTRTIFFAETHGVPSQFSMEGESSVRHVSPGRGIAFRMKGTGGNSVSVVVLDEADSLSLWKGSWQGRDRVFLTRAGLVVDGSTVRLTSSNRSELTVGVFPAPVRMSATESDGIFARFTPEAPPELKLQASFEKIQNAGSPRDIPMGEISEPVAREPNDADFSRAAAWRIGLPSPLDPEIDPILRIHYVGDVARLKLGGGLLVDDFFNGRPLDLGLRRYARDLARGDLRLEILPLRKDAISGDKRRIFLAESARPQFGTADALAEVTSIEIVPNYEVRLAAPP